MYFSRLKNPVYRPSIYIGKNRENLEAGGDLDNGVLQRNIRQTVPLSQTMKEQITSLRNWARTHARPASADVEATVPWMVDAARVQEDERERVR